MKNADKKLPAMLWVDLETTGLDPSVDSILEVACFFTDRYLNRIGTPLEMLVKPDAIDVARWDRAVWEMHSSSGLLGELLKDGEKPGSAAMRFKAWYNQNCSELPDLAPEIGKKPVAGSSVHFDVSFLRPFVDSWWWDRQFSHHMIDATCLKELTKRWNPKFKLDEKRDTHRAMADLEDSLALLRAHRPLWSR